MCTPWYTMNCENSPRNVNKSVTCAVEGRFRSLMQSFLVPLVITLCGMYGSDPGGGI